MDTAQWPQEILVKPIEEMIPNTRSSSVTASATTCSNIISSNNNIINNNNNNNNNINSSSNINSKPASTSLERKVRPQKDHAVNCPRCNSTNTKFCYYNNYSLTQPRYFCKTCRRYWTEGGSLRNIPVGGGSRKNKRSSSSTTSSSSANSASKKLSSHDLVASTQQSHHNHHHHNVHQNPKLNYHQGQDLNLGFPPTHNQQHHHHHQQQEFRSLSEFMQLPTIENTPKSQIPNSGADNTNTGGNANNHHQLSALELLNGLTSSRGLTPFMPMPVPDPNGVYSSGFPLHDYKPSLNFSLVDGLGNGYGSLQGDHVHQQQQQTDETNNGRLLFPFEDLKQVSSTTSADHNANTNSADNHDQNGEQGDSTPGYWSGMLGNGGSW